METNGLSWDRMEYESMKLKKVKFIIVLKFFDS